MNADFLCQAIAKDLRLEQDDSEENISFINRVIYSASSCWLKTKCLDVLSDDDAQTMGVSSHYLSLQLTSILEEYLKCFPSLELFLGKNNLHEAASIVIKRMRRHGEVVGNNDGYWKLTSLTRSHLGKNIYTLKGCLLDHGVSYSGLATIQYVNEVPRHLSTETALQWFTKFSGSLKWIDCPYSLNEVEIFDPAVTHKNNYSAWRMQTTPSFAINMARRPQNEFQKEYFLLRTSNQKTKMALIDKNLITLKEHRRIIFALRQAYKHPLTIKVEKKNRRILDVKFPCKLPEKESRLLEVYGWPKTSIEDRFNFQFIPVVWQAIRPQFVALGLNFTESKNE